MNILTKKKAAQLLPKRPIDSNKATFGKVLHVAGSLSYRGAAFLTAMASLKAGAGYSILASIKEVTDSVTSLSPDIITLILKSSGGTIRNGEHKKILKLIEQYNVLTIGNGLSSAQNNNQNVKRFFSSLIKGLPETSIPVIIDADGLNFLSEDPLLPLPVKTILTPHPRELSRLLGVSTEQIQSDRPKYANTAAWKFSATIVLKGHNTLISDGERMVMNATGNSALAKAGTGDVLCGMIAGFCAQGLNPFDAASLAVYLHGKAGELAAVNLTEYGVLGSDLLRYIPLAIKTLKK